jgi:hypothetical protein
MIEVRGVFDTEETAQEFAATYRGEYPREGYGTLLTVRSWTPGEWVVQGSRYTSCGG